MFDTKIALRTLLKEDVKLVSFDVFDTLLHRVCHPDALIEESCKRLARSLNRDPSQIIKIRFQAADTLRRASVAADHENDPEYRFHDLARAIVDALDSGAEFDRQQCDDIVKASLDDEIEMEMEAVFPNCDMIEFARSLKENGKAICATSDMYHSSQTILRMLTKVGAGDLFQEDNIFVSGERGVSKASGKLFPVVSQHFRITLQQLAHIGDNRHADIDSPRKFGIRVFDFNADHHHVRYKSFRNLAKETLATAAHEAGLATLDASNIHHRVASAIAPILCDFTVNLAQQTQHHNRSDVWFLARDGYLLKRLYDLFNDGTFAPSGYLFVSRRSTSPASSPTYSVREAFLAEWNGENRRLSTMMSPIGLSPEEAVEMANRYGFSTLDEPLDNIADPRFVAIINDPLVTTRMHETFASSRANLICYLENSGFLQSTSPAVVDVGWAGQIQEAIQLAMRQSDKSSDIVGYYLALRHLGGLRRLAGVKSVGLLHDCGAPTIRSESIFAAVDIFEDTCRAPHGTVLGYSMTGEPILADESRTSFTVEQKDNSKLAALQEAILAYARNWFTFVKIHNYDAASFHEFALDATTELTRFPTIEQAEYFTSIGHGLDFSNDTVLEHRATRTYNPLQIARSVKHARWKEATATTHPFGAVLQTILYLMKSRRKPVRAPVPGGHPLHRDDIVAKTSQTARPELIFPVEKDCPNPTAGKMYRPGIKGRIISKLTKYHE